MFCYINTKSDQNVIYVNFSTLICLKYKYGEILWFRWNTWSWTNSDHGLRHKQWLCWNSWVWEIFADLWSGCTLQLSSYLVSNWSWESQYFPHHLPELGFSQVLTSYVRWNRNRYRAQEFPQTAVVFWDADSVSQGKWWMKTSRIYYFLSEPIRPMLMHQAWITHGRRSFVLAFLSRWNLNMFSFSVFGQA